MGTIRLMSFLKPKSLSAGCWEKSACCAVFPEAMAPSWDQLSAEELVAKCIAPIKKEYWLEDEGVAPVQQAKVLDKKKSGRQEKRVCWHAIIHMGLPMGVLTGKLSSSSAYIAMSCSKWPE